VGSGGDARGEWDFFVSYAQADRAWAEWIAWTLEEDGHRVVIQAWDFVPGSNWVQKMQDGVREVRRTVAVLSAEYLQSVYGGAEWQGSVGAGPGRGWPAAGRADAGRGSRARDHHHPAGRVRLDEANSVHLAGLAPRCSPWRLQTTRGYPGSRHGR
jgi:hypothetical protein